MVIKKCSLKTLGIVTLSTAMLEGGILPSVSFAKESIDESITNGIST